MNSTSLQSRAGASAVAFGMLLMLASCASAAGAPVAPSETPVSSATAPSSTPSASAPPTSAPSASASTPAAVAEWQVPACEELLPLDQLDPKGLGLTWHDPDDGTESGFINEFLTEAPTDATATASTGLTTCHWWFAEDDHSHVSVVAGAIDATIIAELETGLATSKYAKTTRAGMDVWEFRNLEGYSPSTRHVFLVGDIWLGLYANTGDEFTDHLITSLDANVRAANPDLAG